MFILKLLTDSFTFARYQSRALTKDTRNGIGTLVVKMV